MDFRVPALADGYGSDPFPEWSTDDSEEEERPRARRRRGGRGNSVAPDAVTEPAGPLPPHPLMVRLVEPSGSESGEVQFLGPFDNHDHDTEQVRQRVLRYLYHKAKLYRRLLRHTDGADYEEATVGEHGLDIYFELYSGTPILAEIRLLPDAAAVRGWELTERCDPIRVDLNKEQQRPMVLLTHPPERKDVLDAEEGLRQFYPGYRLTAAPAPAAAPPPVPVPVPVPAPMAAIRRGQTAEERERALQDALALLARRGYTVRPPQ